LGYDVEVVPVAAAELFLRAEVGAGTPVCCGAQEGAVEMLQKKQPLVEELEIMI
jgi:hypothetical protein